MNNLKIIYEDNHIIVVEKIPNIPSQADKTGYRYVRNNKKIHKRKI
jgi:23S rRNA-/tRNA-specific pseudouridylate synthase